LHALEVISLPSDARLASLCVFEQLRTHFTRSLSVEAKFGTKFQEQRVFADGDCWFHQSFEGVGLAERTVFRFGRLSTLTPTVSPLLSISIPLYFERAQARNAFFLRNKSSDQIQVAGRIEGSAYDRVFSENDIELVANSGIWPVTASASTKDFLLTPLIASDDTNGARVAYVIDHTQNLGARKKLTRREKDFVSARINELAVCEPNSRAHMSGIKRAWVTAHLRNWLINRRVKVDRFPLEANFDVTVTKNKLLNAAYRVVIDGDLTQENIFRAWSIRAIEDRMHDFTIVIPENARLPVEGRRFPARDRIRVIRYRESDSDVEFIA
jgi:hypothetical protein